MKLKWLASAMILPLPLAGASKPPKEAAALKDKFLSAVEGSDLDGASRALALGADVNARRYGLGALDLARINGSKALEQLLVSKGADAGRPMPPPEDVIESRLRGVVAGDSAGLAVLAARDGRILFERGFA